MTKTNFLKSALAVVAVLGFTTAASAQVSLTNGSPTYTQNFDSLQNTGAATAWTDNTTLVSWYAQRQNAGAINLTPGTGSSNSGQLYSYGVDTVAERALGGLGSGTPGHWAYGVRLKNNGTTNITDIQVQVRGEQWRNGGNTNAQPVDFYYTVSGAAITGITNAQAATPGANGYTLVSALTLTTPIVGATAAALDGNLPANQVNANQTFPVIVAPGSEIMLMWHDINDSGNDHGIGIDDLTVTATFAAAGATWSTTALGGTFNDGGFARVDSANGPFTVTATVNATGTTVINSVTGVAAPFAFTGAVPPLGTTLNASDAQVFTFTYTPAANTGVAEAQQTATLNATTGNPASIGFTLDGQTVKDVTIDQFRTENEGGFAVPGEVYKLTDAIVNANTQRPPQNIVTLQDRTDGNIGTRGMFVFDPSGTGVNGGSLPNIGDGLAVYGTSAKFGGLWEIVPDRPYVVTSTGATLTPVTLLSTDLADNYEAVLVRVNSASVASDTTLAPNTTTTMTTAAGNLDVRVQTGNTTVTQLLLGGVGYDVTGVGSQNDGTNPSAGGTGYQIVPRFNADFATPATSVGGWDLF